MCIILKFDYIHIQYLIKEKFIILSKKKTNLTHVVDIIFVQLYFIYLYCFFL